MTAEEGACSFALNRDRDPSPESAVPITNNTCVCGKHLGLPTGSFDAKCEHCGRVYNQHGVFLWRETPGKELTGVNVGKGEDDKRSPDQIAAAEAALEAGKALPEEPRRESDKADPDLLPPVATQENITTEGQAAEVAKAEGVTTEEVEKRGEHTHKHERGAGHKPFTRSRK